MLTFKALNGLAPVYIQELVNVYQPPRTLISQNSNLLEVVQFKLKTCGPRAFSVAAPKVWNSLPVCVRKAESLCTFKSVLKTHMFREAYAI